MCFSNMYFGLQTGWISMMSLQASLLGFAVFKTTRNDSYFGPKENVYLQTVAVATATMPLAAGFVGIIPALEQLNEPGLPSFSVPNLIFWSLGLSFIGVFFAVPLRKETIVREKLRFPSGTATAQMIHILHNKSIEITDDETNQQSWIRRRNVGSIENEGQIELFPLVESDQHHREDAGQSSRNLEDMDVEEKVDDLWSLKLNALLISFIMSSSYTLASYFFPIIYALPVFNWITLNYIDFKAWEWYFTPSLSYVGQGIIMGLPTTLSMLMGCIVGWAILSPVTHFSGWAPGPVNDWKTGSKGWILWISLGVMISESIVSLFIVLIKQIVALLRKRHSKIITEEQEDQYESFLGDYDDDNQSMQQTNDNTIGVAIADNRTTSKAIIEKEQDAPPEQQVPMSMTVLGLTMSVLLCVVMVRIVFGDDVMPIGMTLVSILIALFLSILGVRALGETDLNPVSGIGKVSQVLFAVLMPGSIVANLVAGGIAEAGAQQAGDLMQDLKTGYLLGASPRAQFYGQLIGSLVSSFVATAAYRLYTTVYNVPGPEFPAPTAQVWLDMARLVNGHPLPPHVIEFIVAFSVIFGVLVLVKEIGPTRWRFYIPQGIAFAIGIYNTPSFTLARVIGGCLCAAWDYYCDHRDSYFIDRWCRPYKAIGKVAIIIVASGFVLGEGTFAIINMILHALHVPHF
ncbi:MAG: OPT oligopeptide transporter protein-domain-containing protein [Benjaminiella poitrasii]|nr:MAG: OPT oligopeptide transporter protein-domain-containing protein [Benjaminiella poitrasii]